MPPDVFRFTDNWPEYCRCCWQCSAIDPGSLPTFLHKHFLIFPKLGCQMQCPYQTVWQTSLLISQHSALIQLAPQPAATAVTHPLMTTQLKRAPKNGVQVRGQHGFKVFPTPTYRKARAKSVDVFVFNTCLHTIHFLLHLLVIHCEYFLFSSNRDATSWQNSDRVHC